MKRILVTGSAGFLGARVVTALRARGDLVVTFDVPDSVEALPTLALGVNAVVHLAGVNRPTDPDDFVRFNADLTRLVVDAVLKSAPDAVVVLSSSTQAGLANRYGESKIVAERALGTLALANGRGVIFRFPNLFGPGARPNYNSAVATFAHNAAHGIPSSIHERERVLALLSVHDAVEAVLGAVDNPPVRGTCEQRDAGPTQQSTVGEIADLFESFSRGRREAMLPRLFSRLDRELYATFLSYIPSDALGYDLRVHRDDRGGLAEFLKAPGLGQIFISRTVPGVTRGNHFHFTKTEKFLVMDGDAIIRLRPVAGGPVTEHPVSGKDYRVVDIPPDHAHSIENVGASELVVLFWASEPFDPTRPDTTPLNVLAS